MKFDIGGVLLKFHSNIQVLVKIGNNNGRFTWKPTDIATIISSIDS
jgi:hypothetical protein